MALRIDRLVPRKIGLATTQPVRPPEQLERALIVPGRGAMTEAQPLSPLKPAAASAPVGALVPSGPDESVPLTSPAVAPSAAAVIAPELPVRRFAPRRLGPGTRAVVAPFAHQSIPELVKKAAEPSTPETPLHAYLHPATTPLQAAHNRSLRKSSAVARGNLGPRVRLGYGVSPTDLANGLQTPGRGLWGRSSLRVKPGTPGALAGAPVDELPVSLTPGSTSDSPDSGSLANLAPLQLTGPGFGEGAISTAGAGDDVPPADSLAEAEGSGEGLGRLAFLAGAVFVAWMVLGRGHAA